jgi:TetR/AcrR family transcriptional repressor of lmrAB and yxaGH operons
MATDTRDRMIDGAAVLLAKRGLQATSFSEVIEATGAPRGSLYHHFPDGKDQLVAAAIDRAGARANDLLEAHAGEPAEQIAAVFLGMWRELLTRSRFEAGCAVLAVTVATDSPDLLDHAATVFRTWRARLASLLEQGGLDAAAASAGAVTLIAGAEGAVVLARAEQSLEPFDAVAEQLLGVVRRT